MKVRSRKGSEESERTIAELQLRPTPSLRRAGLQTRLAWRSEAPPYNPLLLAAQQRLPRATRGFEVALSHDVRVMGDVSGDDVGKGSHRELAIARDTAPRPSVGGQRSEEGQRRRADGAKLAHGEYIITGSTPGKAPGEVLTLWAYRPMILDAKTGATIAYKVDGACPQERSSRGSGKPVNAAPGAAGAKPAPSVKR